MNTEIPYHEVIAAMRAQMMADNDLPSDIRAFDPEQDRLAKERAENMLKLQKISVGNRFRLMFGQPLLPENQRTSVLSLTKSL